MGAVRCVGRGCGRHVTPRRRDPVGPAWPGGVALLLGLLFVVLLLGAPLWGAPLMVIVTLVYLLGWTRWRDARRARIAPRPGERATITSLLSSVDPTRLPIDLRDRAFMTATWVRRRHRQDLLDRMERIEERISALTTRLLLLTLSELERDSIRASIGRAEQELALARQAANATIFALIPDDAALVVRRATRAECDCPEGHWGCHAIVDGRDGRVLRECAACDPPVRWIETIENERREAM